MVAAIDRSTADHLDSTVIGSKQVVILTYYSARARSSQPALEVVEDVVLDGSFATGQKGFVSVMVCIGKGVVQQRNAACRVACPHRRA